MQFKFFQLKKQLNIIKTSRKRCVIKICVTGAQGLGKTTLINEFIKNWPMYKMPSESYRDIAKRNPKVQLNQNGSEESQEIIRDALIDQAITHSKDENIIFDRCVLDNFVYSMWLAHNGKVSDLFMERQIPILKESLKLYDIIFFIPKMADYEIPIVPSADGQRDLDPVFQTEIDNLFKAMIMDYWKEKRTFFPSDDCPAVIDIPVGPLQDRINYIKLYVNKSGGCFGEEDSLIANPDNVNDIFIGANWPANS